MRRSPVGVPNPWTSKRVPNLAKNQRRVGADATSEEDPVVIRPLGALLIASVTPIPRSDHEPAGVGAGPGGSNGRLNRKPRKWKPFWELTEKIRTFTIQDQA
ncbi:MAG: hypothetical protein LC808_16575, partial [Actinobacteria bacterium]|nr:hypothetical protein [Actinomycetota bacterium]